MRAIAAALGRNANTWRKHAACRGVPNPDRFFSKGISHSTLKLCADCPVREKCLEAALRTPPQSDFGIWGGTTAKQRVKLRAGRGIVFEDQDPDNCKHGHPWVENEKYNAQGKRVCATCMREQYKRANAKRAQKAKMASAGEPIQTNEGDPMDVLAAFLELVGAA